MTRATRLCCYGNVAIMLGLAIYFFLVPAGIIIHDLTDPNLRGPGVPRLALRLFQDLTPDYELWARTRVASGRAAALSTRDISGTEWPLFGSVFYLWAVEALQEAYEKDPRILPQAPKVEARGAIEAATALVMDPNHAAWVRKHWGENYLRTENIFYRALVIASLTAYTRLTGDEQHVPALREQVESLVRELEASPHGLLEDYPGECYPGDVLTSIACIRRADAVLGTDHAVFVQRALRAFQGPGLDKRGLVPYAARSRTGQALGPSRGCGNSYVSLSAPALWPVQARQWYDLYEKHFWQERWTAVGFREFPKDLSGFSWYMDVDAGPVLAGHGISACAFGVGAARVNGRFDHAFPLSAEMLVALWPLPHGTLASPRILSNATDAPYLGEAAILYVLTRQPAPGFAPTPPGPIPLFVYILLALYISTGLLLVVSTWLDWRRWSRQAGSLSVPRPAVQAALWIGLVAGACVALAAGSLVMALLFALVARMLPRASCAAQAEAC